MKKEKTLEKNGFCIVESKEEADKLKTSDDFDIQGPFDKTEKYCIVYNKEHINESLARNILEVGYNYDFIFDNIDAVFLDTNVFYGANFKLGDKNFKEFLEKIKEINIQIFITDVIFKEVNRGIDKEIESYGSKLLKILNDLKFLDNVKANIISEKIKEKFKEEINNIIKICSTDNIKSGDIIGLWEKYSPPFSKQKPNDFIDGINLLYIKKYVNKNSKSRVALISNDKDCLIFCKQNNIFGINTIYDFNRFIDIVCNLNKIETAIHQKIKEAKFNQEIEAINRKYAIMDICKEQLSKYLENKNEAEYDNLFYFNINLHSGRFRIDYAEAKVDSLVVKNSMYTNITDDNTVSVLFDLSLEISVDTGKYIHEPSSHGYDKEDNEYYCKEYKKTKFRIKKDISDILFLVDYDQDKKTIGTPFPTHEIRIHGDIDEYEKSFTSDEFIYD